MSQLFSYGMYRVNNNINIMCVKICLWYKTFFTVKGELTNDDINSWNVLKVRRCSYKKECIY